MFKPMSLAIMSHRKGYYICFPFFFASNLLYFGSSQVEEKKVSEKTLQTPLLPSPVADHVKCNILKAQLENASRVSAGPPLISRGRMSSGPERRKRRPGKDPDAGWGRARREPGSAAGCEEGF